jgi:hypothetical protein
MKTETLNEIVNHFKELYAEEINNSEVSEEIVYEWWLNTAYQYGYSQDELTEPYKEIEKAILTSI